MHEAMAYADKFFQIILAVSRPHSCKAPASSVGGIHWLSSVVPCFARFDDFCLYTNQPANPDCDGKYFNLPIIIIRYSRAA
jgi:hypothetical protein